MSVGNQVIPNIPIKEREVKIGDQVQHWATGYIRWGTVIAVTKKYVVIQYTSPSTGIVHKTKRHRDIALMYSKFY